MRGSNNKVRAAILAGVVSLFAACGGGGGSGSSGAAAPAGGIDLQVVSFGDSLSDVGTYAPIASAVGGGRFTTNPGQVWTQDVAQYYGDTLTAAFTINLAHELSAQGGLGYAEGGSTVATPADQNDFLTDVIGNVEMPVNQQVSSYLSAHGSSTPVNWCWSGLALTMCFVPGHCRLPRRSCRRQQPLWLKLSDRLCRAALRMS